MKKYNLNPREKFEPGLTARRQKKRRHPTRPAEYVIRTTKGLCERAQLYEWNDGET